MNPLHIRQGLQRVFEHWGRPLQMRFDNGAPWGTASQVPSALALWLVGLGIQPVFGRPRQSTDNAVVERCHGVMNGWVEPAQCLTFAMLAERLQYFSWVQRERYPACHGQARRDTYPALSSQPRPYRAPDDQALWSEQAVFDYLAQFRFQRKVEINGRITLLNREYSVGRQAKRRTVSVQMDASTHEWVIYDDYGAELRRCPPKALTYATISQMTLAYRRRR